MTDKIGNWKTYPENKPEKKGYYFVIYRKKDNNTISRGEAHYDGEGFSTRCGLEVVGWAPESEFCKKENEAEDKKDQLIKAIKVIKETCLKNSCEICPFGDNVGDCLLLADIPENWTPSREQVWRALK